MREVVVVRGMERCAQYNLYNYDNLKKPAIELLRNVKVI